jgi:hypothetical protein
VKPRRRYAIVGLGSRSLLYTSALLGKYRQGGELAGLCDVNAHPDALAQPILSARPRCFRGADLRATGQPVDLTALVKLQHPPPRYPAGAAGHQHHH